MVLVRTAGLALRCRKHEAERYRMCLTKRTAVFVLRTPVTRPTRHDIKTINARPNPTDTTYTTPRGNQSSLVPAPHLWHAADSGTKGCHLVAAQPRVGGRRSAANVSAADALEPPPSLTKVDRTPHRRNGAPQEHRRERRQRVGRVDRRRHRCRRHHRR